MFPNLKDSHCGLVLAIAIGLGVACNSPEPAAEDQPAIRFAEVVEFQDHQVTTDLISIPEGLGLQTVGSGWQRVGGSDIAEDSLAVTSKTGRLLVFSAEGDVEEIELEIRLGSSQSSRVPLHILWNGERIARLHPTAEWSNYLVGVPSGTTRVGVNVLDLAPRARERPRSNRPGVEIRLRRARFRSPGGRPLWSTRPQQIRHEETLQLPVPSFIDLVVEVPADGRLRGRWSFQDTESAKGPSFAYLELLGEAGRRRTLFHERLYKSVSRPVTLDRDLSQFGGQFVRLRAGVTGNTNGVVHWHDLRLTGASLASIEPAVPPIQQQRPPSSGRIGKPDVLLVLLDAARADAFSPWGGLHDTPALERLAGDGTIFAQALSPAPWTAQSVPAILTGLFPDTLGVGPWGSRLPVEVPTLAEVVAAAGYRTVLWSQHPIYSNHKSFRRGFETFHRSPPGAYQALPAREDLVAEDRPTLAFVHLIPPHAPYSPPRPFRGAFSSGYTGDFPVDADHLEAISNRSDSTSLSEQDRRYVFDRYLENAAFADDLVGRILAILDQASSYRDSLIVVLSDHGEAFMEHGRFLHTHDVHREFLQVPFVIKWPASISGFESTVEEPVSLVDLVATLADGLGILIEGEGLQGRSLLPTVFDHEPLERPIYAMTRGTHNPDRASDTKLMLEADGWRILLTPQSEAIRLYNAGRDPGESHDLETEQPLQALLMRQATLAQWYYNRRLLGREGPAEDVDELDEETREQLEALGYLN